jgi:hypothetical protein
VTVPPPSPRCSFTFPLVPRVVMAPERYGLTSSQPRSGTMLDPTPDVKSQIQGIQARIMSARYKFCHGPPYLAIIFYVCFVGYSTVLSGFKSVFILYLLTIYK